MEMIGDFIKRTRAEEERLREVILKKFREKQYDDGLDTAVRLVREPGGTPVGEAVRALLATRESRLAIFSSLLRPPSKRAGTRSPPTTSSTQSRSRPWNRLTARRTSSS
jgi:hypothetical protein